jgi:small subunit ribosomal protein S20
MAHTKSAIKKIRHDEKRRLINKRNSSKLRTGIKKFRALLDKKNKEELQKVFPQTLSLIDKSVHKKVILQNTAARLKSRLTRHYNDIVKETAEKPSDEGKKS